MKRVCSIHEVIDTVIALAQRYHVDGFIATGPTMDRSNLSTAAKIPSTVLGFII